MKRFKFDYSFIITIILIIFSPYQKILLMLLGCLFIHELGHIFIAYIFKIKINSIKLTALGFFMDADVGRLSFLKEVLFYSFGIIIQCISLLFLSNEMYEITKYIILINLIPIYPFDGYQIIKCFISYIFKYKLSLYIINILGIIVAAIAFIYSLFSNVYLVSMNIFYGLVLNILELLKVRYIYESFVLYRYLNDVNYKKRYVSLEKNIWKHLYRYHNIYSYLGKSLINESEILDLHYNS